MTPLLGEKTIPAGMFCEVTRGLRYPYEGLKIRLQLLFRRKMKGALNNEKGRKHFNIINRKTAGRQPSRRNKETTNKLSSSRPKQERESCKHHSWRLQKDRPQDLQSRQIRCDRENEGRLDDLPFRVDPKHTGNGSGNPGTKSEEHRKGCRLQRTILPRLVFQLFHLGLQ
jgi:hypothetical protein